MTDWAKSDPANTSRQAKNENKKKDNPKTELIATEKQTFRTISGEISVVFPFSF
jgi:hypothetical protein